MRGSKSPPDASEWRGECGPPEFDLDLAQSYVGRTILVGITYLSHDDKLLGQQQLHGTITSADRNGIVIALAGKRAGQSWTMPPSLEGIQRASPGEYRLRETGEVIVDPDLLSTWTINKPPPQ